MLYEVITVSISPDETVESAARIMRDKDISCLLVCENGALAGIMTTGDLTNRVLAEGKFGDVRVREAMTPNPQALSRNNFV